MSEYQASEKTLSGEVPVKWLSARKPKSQISCSYRIPTAAPALLRRSCLHLVSWFHLVSLSVGSSATSLQLVSVSRCVCLCLSGATCVAVNGTVKDAGSGDLLFGQCIFQEGKLWQGVGNVFRLTNPDRGFFFFPPLKTQGCLFLQLVPKVGSQTADKNTPRFWVFFVRSKSNICCM